MLPLNYQWIDTFWNMCKRKIPFFFFFFGLFRYLAWLDSSEGRIVWRLRDCSQIETVMMWVSLVPQTSVSSLLISVQVYSVLQPVVQSALGAHLKLMGLDMAQKSICTYIIVQRMLYLVIYMTSRNTLKLYINIFKMYLMMLSFIELIR